MSQGLKSNTCVIAPHPASRIQGIGMEGVDDEENANLLQFGEEHSKDDMSCLSNAEVSMVLEKQRGAYEEKDINVTP